jgi:salicylate hydroxylase
MWVIHRADLQLTLLRRAQALGVAVHTDARIERVDFAVADDRSTLGHQLIGAPRILLKKRGEAEGAWLDVDVVIAADGIRSKTRAAMMAKLGAVDEGRSRVAPRCATLSARPAEETGDAAYRIVIPRAKFEGRPELLKILDEPVAQRIMGPHGHIMAYPLRNHEVYNMILAHPAREGMKESWTSVGPRALMDEFYASWSPTVRGLLGLVDDEDIPEWPLRIHKPLASWVEGRVALMGDACHPTLPYVAQGAAQAVEDAAVLAVVLSLTTRKEDSASAVWRAGPARAQPGAQSTSPSSCTASSGRTAPRRSSLLRRACAATCTSLTAQIKSCATTRSPRRAAVRE